MSRQVTLGGDRLGSGGKNRVELHGFERSNHDLSYIWRSSMASGTLVPFLSKPILPGDSFDIDLNCNVMTHPTIGPLFGSFKVQLDLFQIPVRLYVGILHQNKTKIGLTMGQIMMPQIEMAASWDAAAIDLDNSQVNPSSIFAYLGIRGVGKRTSPSTPGSVSRRFNAIPYAGYWDIYKQYYANKQEEVGYYIHYEPVIVQTVTTVGGSWGSGLIPQAPGAVTQPITRASIITINFTGAVPPLETIYFKTNKGDFTAKQLWEDVIQTTTKWELTNLNRQGVEVGELISWRYISSTDPQDREPKAVQFPLTNIDAMREKLQVAMGVGTAAIINTADTAPYGPPLKQVGGIWSKNSSQEGLGLKTYQSDLYNNWLNDEWIDGVGGVNAISSVSTQAGSFTIDALNMANKVYNLFNRIAVTDGTYNAYIQAAYDHDMYGLATNPVYEGGLSKELEFQEVVSNAAAGDGDQPLGTLAGKGVMGQKHKGGRANIKANEIGWVMGIVSLTPRIDYSQGNEWDVNLKTIADFHVPNLDGIGFQDLNADQMHWAETTSQSNVTTFRAVGKQPAWINYMTAVNKTFGNFAIKGQEMFMTLNRNYGIAGTGITDLTTYIDPVKYNQVFAYTARDAQNFWVQIRIGMTARRKMSAKVMPNL